MTERNIPFRDKWYPTKFYSPSEDGNIGDCGYDSETSLIVEGEVSDFVLGMAYNGDKVYFIKKDDVKAFFDNHRSQQVWMFNAPFDLEVAGKVGAWPCTLRMIIQSLDTGKRFILDEFLLEKLDVAANKGQASHPSLASLYEKLFKYEISKDDQDENGVSVRTNYGSFIRKDGSIDYEAMSQPYFTYAAIDAIATWEIAQAQRKILPATMRAKKVDPKLLLSHDLQLKFFICSTKMSRNGICVDLPYLEEVRNEITHELNEVLDDLEGYGYSTGKGSMSKLKEIISKLGIKLSKSDKGRDKTSREALMKYKDSEPFINSYLKLKDLSKLMEFLNDKPIKVHQRVNPLVATGRTSSSKPNMQQIPKDDKVRGIFRPNPGHGWIDTDYSTVELRALSQICLKRYGFSKMGEIINSGVDLHTYFAAQMRGVPMDQVSKKDRNKAKIANFAIPGGFGPPKIVDFAKTSYNTEINLAEAKKLKEDWLNTFPEMRRYLKDSEEIPNLVSSGLMKSYTNFTSKYISKPESAAYTFRGIIQGNNADYHGNEYTDKEIEWAFNILDMNDFPNKEKYLSEIEARQGNMKLAGDFLSQYCSVIYDSGRVMGNCVYTQARNAPFQGLTSDGFKEAFIDLTLAGYTIVNAIHDEIIVELPLTSDFRKAKADISRIMIAGMAKHIKDIKIEVDSEFMINWQKSGTHIADKDGVLIPAKWLYLNLDIKRRDDLNTVSFETKDFYKVFGKDFNDETMTYNQLIDLIIEKDLGIDKLITLAQAEYEKEPLMKFFERLCELKLHRESKVAA